MEERHIAILIEQATARMHLADWRGATDLLRRALAIDPDHPGAHAHLALALLGAKRLAGAAVEFQIALGLDGNDPMCHYAAAAVLRAQRKLDTAWEHCQVALQSDETDADTHVLGAEIRVLRGELSEARELLDRALELESSHTGALVAMARLELAAHRHDEAARWASDALESAPADLDAHVVAGLVDLVRGDTVHAEEHARFALGQDANDRGAIELWAAIKARRSWLLGTWWRLNAWLSLRSESGQIAVLIGSFVVVRVVIILAGAAGWHTLESMLGWVWLGVCAYTWFAPTLWKRMIASELGTVTLDPDY